MQSLVSDAADQHLFGSWTCFRVWRGVISKAAWTEDFSTGNSRGPELVAMETNYLGVARLAFNRI